MYYSDLSYDLNYKIKTTMQQIQPFISLGNQTT